jgi:ribosomal protein S18 acetylase RimI-like enzyme
VGDLRTRRPVETDHGDLLTAIGAWWGGRGPSPAALLPRLFLQHFTQTSEVVHDGPELVAFLVGFLSPDHHDEAYLHVVGVAPAYRGQGLAADLYERFFEQVLAAGRTRVTAITSPANTGSQAFHARMGFAVSDPVPDYDGAGGDRVVFSRDLVGGPDTH